MKELEGQITIDEFIKMNEEKLDEILKNKPDFTNNEGQTCCVI